MTCDDMVAGEYATDPIAEQARLVELKAVNALNEAQQAQCIDSLKASGPRPGLLLGFGMKRLEIEGVANSSVNCSIRAICGIAFLNLR
jgi:GxxExxY protein